jgi:hypothetical protein
MCAKACYRLSMTFALAALCSACGAGAEESESLPVAEAPPVTATSQACRAPAGVSAKPRSTDEAVQLLNALPKPTTVSCFVESLERPLAVFATSSSFSAQPAFSGRSPRVFVQLDRLWLSLVIAGESSRLLEFGELEEGTPLRSIKGELELPLAAAVPASAPYDRVLRNEGTVCALCHYEEQHAAGVPFPNAFSSIAFRPRPEGHVTLEALRLEEQSCDRQVEPERCELLTALLGHGDLSEAPFPDAMQTIY